MTFYHQDHPTPQPMNRGLIRESPASPSPHSSPVQEALDRLDSCISSLSASIDGLNAKTACVQAPTASDKPPESPESSCSQLVSQIHSLRDRIVRIDYQARMMLERIEL